MIKQTTTLWMVLVLASGCSAANTPPGLAQTAVRDVHREYVRECMARHTEQIFELSQLDPTYLMRFCRKEAYQRLSRSARSGSSSP